MKKFIKKILGDLKYNFGFLSVLNSPFKGLKLTFYFGEISKGTPYFLPRKWVKFTKKDAKEWAEKQIVKNGFMVKGKTFDEIVEQGMHHKKPVTIKWFGINFHGLGWKTKFSDYRFEFNPGLSIVVFGKQLYIGVEPNISEEVHSDVYWEAWLNYIYTTDSKLSKEERFKELIQNHSCTWIRYSNDTEIKIDYYPLILKNKYLKVYEDRNK
jgi:hypothetical protein